MAHTLVYDAPQVASVAANLVSADTVLSALVSRNFTPEFLGEGSGGRPVSVKIPTTLIARERDIDDVTTSIELDNIVEQRRTITLDPNMAYSAVPLSEADLNLNLEDFSAQVLRPQAAAIADSIERKVELALKAVPVTSVGTYNAADPVKYFTLIRKFLRDNGVPVDGIQCVVGTEVYANLLDANAITDASASGSTAALREASVGKVRGLTVVESTRMADDEVLAFHRDAVTLVTRAPAVPQGAAFGAQISEAGFSIRYLRDYDALKTVDRSIVASFAGVGILPTYKIERDYTGRTVNVTELANGGVLHLDTAV